MALRKKHGLPQGSQTAGTLSPKARRRTSVATIGRRLQGRNGWEVLKRVVIGCYNDGLIHAGNLAYMSMLAIFPFFILGAAAISVVGAEADRAATIGAVLGALPPIVGNVIEPVARNVVEARSGWLLWAGAFVGLWTVGSLIETIRDILRRAYGSQATRAFWQYRLLSTGIIIIAMLLLILSLFAQVAISTAQQIISAYMPELNDALGELAWSRIIPGMGLFGSIYLLFYTLTPGEYRHRHYPKWPGALLVTVWWVAVSVMLPRLLRSIFALDLTYGSLAGIMIALFFFWLVGLGMVAGAEFNAALAEPSDEEAEREADENDSENTQENTS